MSSDYGLSISPPNVNAVTAGDNELLLNSNYPFYKIDTQNDNGFRTTFINFVTNPPEPGGAGYTFTVVHSYAHNYKYITAIQALFYARVPPTGTLFTQNYFFDDGVIAQRTAFDGVNFFCYADATNIYFVIRKYRDAGSGGLANDLSGAFYQITVYNPVEDVGL
jgi:hypothetical protein